MGYSVLNSDIIAKEAYKKDSSIYNKLFGLIDSLKQKKILEESETYLDSSMNIDTKKLIPYFIRYKNLLDDFESIIHPWVYERFLNLATNYQNGEILFFESSLLVEINWYERLHSLVLVSCNTDIRHQRLIQRGSQSVELSNFLESRQFSEEQKKKLCSYIIDSNCSMDELKSQVKMLCLKIMDEINIKN